MSDSFDVDFVIVGGGIVGLLTAIQIKEKNPSAETIIIEKMPFLGDHSTGRNSGVLHSGIYYQTDSLKHKLCMKGLELWPILCGKFEIPYRNCGKVIFAHDSTELKRLNEISMQADQNDVKFEFLSRKNKEIHSEFINIFEGIFIPSTGIVDISEALLRLSSYFESIGGIIQRKVELISIIRNHSSFTLHTNQYEVETKNLINCAGLWSTFVRELIGLKDLGYKWVKGHYLKTSQNLQYQYLYYPTPPSDLKGLGVHSTIDITGKVKFGPDTLDVDQIEYSMNDLNVKSMKESINIRFKNIDSEKLSLDYAGIRSKITIDSKIHKDFWIKGPAETGIEGYAEACGIESPGLTSSPAIAKLISGFFN